MIHQTCPVGGTVLLSDVPFAAERHPRLVGDLYLPGWAAGAPLALVIHGGGWLNSDKSSLAPVCEMFAGAGIAAFAINYRRLTEAPWPACWQDGIAAFDFLRSAPFLARHGLTADRLMVAGASAGAHLALMTALSRPAGQVAAVLAIAPPTWLEIGSPCCDPFLFSPRFFSMFFGPDVSVTSQALADASPLGRVGPASPPLWLVQSCQDELVPPRHAEELAEAYRSYGRPVRLHYFDGNDRFHGLWVDNDAQDRELAPAARAALQRAIVELLEAV